MANVRLLVIVDSCPLPAGKVCYLTIRWRLDLVVSKSCWWYWCRGEWGKDEARIWASFNAVSLSVGWHKGHQANNKKPASYAKRFSSKTSGGSNYYYYYIRLTAIFSRTAWVSQHQKGKPFWFYWSKRWCVGSGISWTICKAMAPRPWQITTPVPQVEEEAVEKIANPGSRGKCLLV